jgi:hypothetical protein
LIAPVGGMRLLRVRMVSIVLSTDRPWPNGREPFWRHIMSDTFAPVSIREMAVGNVAGSIRAN